MKLTDLLFDFGKDEALSLLMTARRYSGKTFLIKEILNDDVTIKKFNQIVVFSDSGKLDKTWKEVKSKKVVVFDEYYEQDLIDLMESFKRDYLKSGKRPSVLIIIDDLAEVYSAKKDSPINKLATRGRWYGVSFIFTSQKYNLFNTCLRQNSTSNIFFKIYNGREAKTISEDISSRRVDVIDIIDDLTTEPYHYALVKLGEKPKFYEGSKLELNEVDVGL